MNHNVFCPPTVTLSVFANFFPVFIIAQTFISGEVPHSLWCPFPFELHEYFPVTFDIF